MIIRYSEWNDDSMSDNERLEQLFQVGGEEKGLLEIREVTFNYHHNVEGAP